MVRILLLLVLIGISAISVHSFALTDIPDEARFLFETKGEDSHTIGEIFTHYGALGEFKTKSPALFEKIDHFISGLNMEEKTTFKQYFTSYQALEDLKIKSPVLYENVEKLNVYIMENFKSLGTEAKAFVDRVIDEYHKVMDATAAGNKPSSDVLKAKAQWSCRRVVSFFDKFETLSMDAKTDLEENFPLFSVIFKNKKLKNFLTGSYH